MCPFKGRMNETAPSEATGGPSSNELSDPFLPRRTCNKNVVFWWVLPCSVFGRRAHSLERLISCSLLSFSHPLSPLLSVCLQAALGESGGRSEEFGAHRTLVLGGRAEDIPSTLVAPTEDVEREGDYCPERRGLLVLLSAAVPGVERVE